MIGGEQETIDWLADRYAELLADKGAATLAAPEFASHVSRMMYFATGRHFEVRLAPRDLPELAERPKGDHGRYGHNEWRHHE